MRTVDSYGPVSAWPQLDGRSVDVGLVGDVVDVSPQPIIDLLDQGRIPVISSSPR